LKQTRIDIVGSNFFQILHQRTSAELINREKQPFDQLPSHLSQDTEWIRAVRQQQRRKSRVVLLLPINPIPPHIMGAGAEKDKGMVPS